MVDYSLYTRFVHIIIPETQFYSSYPILTYLSLSTTEYMMHDAVRDAVERGLAALGCEGIEGQLPAAHCACSGVVARQLRACGVVDKVATYVRDYGDGAYLGGAVVVACAVMQHHRYSDATLQALISLLEGAGALQHPTPCMDLIISHVCGGISSALSAPPPPPLPATLHVSLLEMILLRNSHTPPAVLTLFAQVACADLGWVEEANLAVLRSLLNACCLNRTQRSHVLALLAEATMSLGADVAALRSIVEREYRLGEEDTARQVLHRARQRILAYLGEYCGDVSEDLVGLIDAAREGVLGEGLECLVEFADVLLMKPSTVHSDTNDLAGTLQAVCQRLQVASGRVPVAVLSYLLLVDVDLLLQMLCRSLGCSEADEHLSEEAATDLASFLGLKSAYDLPSTIPQLMFYLQQNQKLRLAMLKGVFSKPLHATDDVLSGDVVAVATALGVSEQLQHALCSFLSDQFSPMLPDMLFMCGVVPTEDASTTASSPPPTPAASGLANTTAVPSGLLTTMQAGGCPVLSWLTRAAYSEGAYPTPSCVQAVLTTTKAPRTPRAVKAPPLQPPPPRPSDRSNAQLVAWVASGQGGSGLLLLLSEARDAVPCLSLVGRVSALRVPHVMVLVHSAAKGTPFLQLLAQSGAVVAKQKKKREVDKGRERERERGTPQHAQRRKQMYGKAKEVDAVVDPVVMKEHHHTQPAAVQSHPLPDSQPACPPGEPANAQGGGSHAQGRPDYVPTTVAPKRSSVRPRENNESNITVSPASPVVVKVRAGNGHSNHNHNTNSHANSNHTTHHHATNHHTTPAPDKTAPPRQPQPITKPAKKAVPQNPPSLSHPLSQPLSTKKRAKGAHSAAKKMMPVQETETYSAPTNMVRGMMAHEEQRYREHSMKLRNLSKALEGRYESQMYDLVSRCRKDFSSQLSAESKDSRRRLRQGLPGQILDIQSDRTHAPLSSLARTSPCTETERDSVLLAPNTLPPIAKKKSPYASSRASKETESQRALCSGNLPEIVTPMGEDGGGGSGGHVTAKHWVAYTKALNTAVLEDFIETEARRRPLNKRGVLSR